MPVRVQLIGVLLALLILQVIAVIVGLVAQLQPVGLLGLALVLALQVSGLKL